MFWTKRKDVGINTTPMQEIVKIEGVINDLRSEIGGLKRKVWILENPQNHKIGDTINGRVVTHAHPYKAEKEGERIVYGWRYFLLDLNTAQVEIRFEKGK